jgi:hypothetical protein
MIDEPSPYDTLETWESHLKTLQTMPGNMMLRAQMIAQAKSEIADKRRMSH